MTVGDVLHQVLPRLPGPALCTVFEAIREVQSIIAARLVMKRAAQIKKPYPARMEFDAGQEAAALPRDFRALESRPRLEDGTFLSPLAGVVTPGPVRFYEVAGRFLRLHPVPQAPVTVLASYFFRPAAPESLEDELPFYGEFDDVFVNGAAGVLSKGLGVVGDRGFVAMIQSQVDAVLHAGEMLHEQQIADSINGL